MTSSHDVGIFWFATSGLRLKYQHNGVHLPSGTIIQAWKSDALPGVVKAGHRATNSYGWYLNHGCNNYGDGVWQVRGV